MTVINIPTEKTFFQRVVEAIGRLRDSIATITNSSEVTRLTELAGSRLAELNQIADAVDAFAGEIAPAAADAAAAKATADAAAAKVAADALAAQVIADAAAAQVIADAAAAKVIADAAAAKVIADALAAKALQSPPPPSN